MLCEESINKINKYHIYDSQVSYLRFVNAMFREGKPYIYDS